MKLINIFLALNNVGTETRIKRLLKAEELIKENKYLANRLKTLKQNVKKICIACCTDIVVKKNATKML